MYVPDELMVVLGLHDGEPHSRVGMERDRSPDPMVHHLVPPIKKLHGNLCISD